MGLYLISYVEVLRQCGVGDGRVMRGTEMNGEFH
jgi:hypothetical protein